MREAKAVAETFQENVQYNSKTPEGTIPMLIKINADKAKQINELGKDSALNLDLHIYFLSFELQRYGTGYGRLR